MLDTLTLEDFAPRIGERFRLSADAGHSLDVTLIEANGLGAGPQARRAPFSVVFLGPPQPVRATASSMNARAARIRRASSRRGVSLS